MSTVNGMSWRALLPWLVGFLAALALETRLPLSEGEHKLALIGLVIGFYWLLAKMALTSPSGARSNVTVPLKVTVYRAEQPARRNVRRFRYDKHQMACRRLYRAAHRNEVN